MTIERRFSEPVTRCAPPRRRVRQMVLLLLAALVLWLMSGCEVHEPAHEWEDLPRWLRGTLVGLGGFFIIGLTWMAALKVKRDDEEMMERARGGTPEPAKAGTTILREDPLGMPVEWLTASNAMFVQVSCAAEVRNALLHLKRAQETMDLDHIESEIALAQRRLERVAHCLEELVRLQMEARGTEQAHSLFDAGRAWE